MPKEPMQTPPEPTPPTLEYARPGGKKRRKLPWCGDLLFAIPVGILVAYFVVLFLASNGFLDRIFTLY
jgi:hypothetical protein